MTAEAITSLVRSPSLIPLGIGQRRLQERNQVESVGGELVIVFGPIPTIALETLTANVGQVDPFTNETLLDDGARQARRPVLVNGAVAKSNHVERIVHHEIQLIVGESRLEVRVVRVCGPRRIGNVEDQWYGRIFLVRLAAPKEGREASKVEVDHGAR